MDFSAGEYQFFDFALPCGSGRGSMAAKGIFQPLPVVTDVFVGVRAIASAPLNMIE